MAEFTPTVTISLAEYERLKQIEKEYTNQRAAQKQPDYTFCNDNLHKKRTDKTDRIS